MLYVLYFGSGFGEKLKNAPIFNIEKTVPSQP